MKLTPFYLSALRHWADGNEHWSHEVGVRPSTGARLYRMGLVKGGRITARGRAALEDAREAA